MRKLFISLCFSACCSLLAAQTTNPIQEAMANYDYETALMLIDQETPTVPLLYQKGKALKGLGNNLEALSVFQEVVTQDSLNPRAYIEAAECCKSLAKYSEALDYYQNALHINPDNKSDQEVSSLNSVNFPSGFGKNVKFLSAFLYLCGSNCDLSKYM